MEGKYGLGTALYMSSYLMTDAITGCDRECGSLFE